MKRVIDFTQIPMSPKMPRDPLDIIEYAESKGKNVPNYKYGPGFTAQGYYQITNPTWRDFAKAAGVDLSQYPTAMSAPKEVQRAVAEQIYKKRGFQPWKAVEHLRGQENNYSIGGGTPVAATPATGSTPATVRSSSRSCRLGCQGRYPDLRVSSGYRDRRTNDRECGAESSTAPRTVGSCDPSMQAGSTRRPQRAVVE